MTREDAKVFMRKEWRECMKGSFAESAFEIAIEALEQPERKKGKWIEYDNSHCECPFCHEEWSYFDNETEHFNYCPNCGADMREDGEVEEPKKCDTCKHEKEPWFSRCADCSDFELWESKE